MKQYILSNYGSSVAVGMLDSSQVEIDTNLSHNLFNTHVNNNYYLGCLIFSSINQFYKFLIHKNLLPNYKTEISYRVQLKEATNKARSVINNKTFRNSFMLEISRNQTPSHIYSVYSPGRRKCLSSQITLKPNRK